MITFLNPWAFLLLPLGILLGVLQMRRARGRAVTFSSLEPLLKTLRPSWRTRLAWVPDALRLTALLLLTIALARPQIQKTETNLEKDGIAIEMLVDISSSMDMRMDHRGEDATRLAVAKEVLELFVMGDGESLLGRADDLIGIITFARYADTVCPLTLSHEAVVYFARSLSINDRPNEDGTAYGDATALAAARLSTLEESHWSGNDSGPGDVVKSKIIVLLTDGENNCGRHLPDQAAALAQKWGIKIYTISLTDPPRPRRIEHSGRTLEVTAPPTAAERVLEQMAATTGGVYRRAHDYDSLRAIYSEIDKLERSQLRSSAKQLTVELFLPFAITAFLFLFADLLIRHTVLLVTPE